MSRRELLEEAQAHAIAGSPEVATLDLLLLIERALVRIARALEARNELERRRDPLQGQG